MCTHSNAKKYGVQRQKKTKFVKYSMPGTVPQIRKDVIIIPIHMPGKKI